MNYRHAYHAGNFADVMKHALVAWIVEYLKQKPKPIFALDTHAGAGLYRLDAAEATRTGEWREGIGRILDAADAPAEIAPYLRVLTGFGPERYPGSPLLLHALQRPGDRLIACELHPEDFASLTRALPGRGRAVHVMRQDGYGALHALPPPERRGLVLIDPPFEARDEFDRLVRALEDAHRRFATGVFAIWYPIKAGWGTEAFLAELTQTGVKRLIAAELRVRAEDGERLAGSGLAVVNPPFGFARAARTILDWLAVNLAQDRTAGSRVAVLAGE